MPPLSFPTLLGRALALPLLALTVSCATTAPAPSPARTQAPLAKDGWRNDWARDAVFYEVFVRSFQDSDGNGVGDFKGLTARLDYLKELGVGGLWLMPVFTSPSYHGYDTVDYEHVNPAYGTDADFDAFLREAHQRNIRVIVDFVINHTGSAHPWFVESASSPTSPKRDWYVWRQDDPGWTQPWGGSNHTWHEKNGAYFYGIFWGGMPDLNLRNPEVRAEVKRLAKLWLDRGVDGFRLDAARHLIESGPGQGQCDSPETHAFWREFSEYIRSQKPDALLVGENWTETPIIATYYGDTSKVRGGDELPMSFDFPLASALVEGAKTGQAQGIADKLREIQRLYPAGVLDGTFLTNHDMKRVAQQLGEDKAKVKSAAAVLLTLPGTPFLYYGEELGMDQANNGDDEFKRTPMPWDGSETGGFTQGKPWYRFAPGHEKDNVADEGKDPASVLSRYRQLVTLRNQEKALREGSLELLAPAARAFEFMAPTGGPLVYLRQAGSEVLLVAHNLSDQAQEAGPFAVKGAGLTAVFADPQAKAEATAQGVRLSLPAHATGVWRVR